MLSAESSEGFRELVDFWVGKIDGKLLEVADSRTHSPAILDLAYPVTLSGSSEWSLPDSIYNLDIILDGASIPYDQIH